MTRVHTINYKESLPMRIHMKKLPAELEILEFGILKLKYDAVCGALHFTDCELIGIQYGDFENVKLKKIEKLFFYKHPTHGILFCNKEMQSRISKRLEINKLPPLPASREDMGVAN